jgi:thymidylate synthase
MIKADYFYRKNLKEIIYNGSFDKNPRGRYEDGNLAHSKFITQVFEKYNIEKGEFPITTLRNTAIKTGINEILWIYQKQSNCLDVARNMGIHWWNSWDIGNNTIGNRYGYTVKKYNLIDKLLYNLKKDPFSRRHIINLYQEVNLEETDGLYPCAYETIWSVRDVNGELFLDLTLIQRSNDYIMSGYINKIQYVALLMMISSHLSYNVGTFSHFVQNLHIYDRHLPAVDEIMNRIPLDVQPKLLLKNHKSFYDFTLNDFIVEDTNKIKKIESRLDLAI